MTIAGHRILTSYDGQPLICYGCGAIGHMYNACPNNHVLKMQKRRTARTIQKVQDPLGHTHETPKESFKPFHDTSM